MRPLQSVFRPLLLFSGLPILLSGCRLPASVAARSVQPPSALVKYAPLPPVRNVDSPIAFVDVAAGDGLRYRWVVPGKRPLNIRQTMGNGCAFLDYNNDGCLDVLLVGPRLALYEGDGYGHFTDVTHETGLDRLCGDFRGCAIGDYDNDGYADIYISGVQTGVLLHNEERKGRDESVRRLALSVKNRAEERHSKEGTETRNAQCSTLNAQHRVFRDVTHEMGLKPQPWGSSCAFADFDGDGYLDLFVGNYVKFGPDTKPQLCPDRGQMSACNPRFYATAHGVMYHNLSGRRFEDVTDAWNAKPAGADLGVACADFDGSGHPGLAIANDEVGGDLLRNQSAGHMVNISVASGTATDRFGHNHGGMGIDWGDYDNDGRPDLFVTTFAREDKCLYHNLGGGIFEEQSVETGVTSALEPYVSFGCKFADFDNDGWLDLIVASGHVQNNIARIESGATYRQPLELQHNTGRNPVTFERVTRSAGLERLAPIVGRGLAVGDFDNDGRVDALVVDSEGVPLLLHNETRAPGHWIGFTLIGTGKSNRDAYGAVIWVESGKQRLMRICHADGSYLSSSDKRVHIGLGKANRVDKVTIHWPDGRVETRTGFSNDRYYTLTEGKAAVQTRLNPVFQH